ncbi:MULTISPECIES: DUF3304 domain-containing protein [unclassified Duganella]|uniref:DUF3304 domain-containing protein n=1 Tax=unclassified Duganella TaxID=2636909 RepID=UPI000E34E2C0|nr:MULTISPECIES: DUF3304 domain-containing protein [unclassified Duganella]RFP11929.1 DUF3304 domain-containing protein [Duganella sp. BJB475]RFP30061.1 DUF3304 domain-containing protein [Duganella sp. BJB476]
MKTLLAIATSCLSLTMPAIGQSADGDPFTGIYSTIDPRTGVEVDLLKIRKFLDDGYTVFIRGERWSGPFDGKVGEPAQQWAMPGPFPHDPRVVTLAVDELGSLYHLPAGAFSRAGRSDTEYLAQMVRLGTVEMKRRPLITDHRERGERAANDYSALDSDQKIAVSTLNYSAKQIQIGLSDPANKNNAVDTDPLNGYMTSVPNCCFYLPAEWKPSLRVNVEYRADGKQKIMPLAVPKYDSPRNLWVAVQPDGRVEISFPNGYEEDDRQRAMPAPPPAELAVIKAAKLRRIREKVADLSHQLQKMPADAASEFREPLLGLRQEARYMEVLYACKQARKECEMEAQSQSREVH